jgi:hypothetical protein
MIYVKWGWSYKNYPIHGKQFLVVLQILTFTKNEVSEIILAHGVDAPSVQKVYFKNSRKNMLMYM